MNTPRGFASIILILAVIGILALGGAGWFLSGKVNVKSENEITPVSSSNSQSTISATNTPDAKQPDFISTSSVQSSDVQPTQIATTQNHSGTPTVAQIPAITDLTQATPYHLTTASGRLFLYSAGTQLIPLMGLSKKNAQSICFESGADKCLYEGAQISPDSGPVAWDLRITAPQGGAVLSNLKNTNIGVQDEGPAGEYHVYLKHYASTGGGIDRAYEAHLISVSGSDSYTFNWDLRNVFLDGDLFLQFKTLPAGFYALTVVNATTAAAAETIIEIRDDSNKGTLVKPYTEGTPFYNDSSWDGRGILMDGDGGIDTLVLSGKRAEYNLYRGKDMPEKNQYNTIVLRQNISGAIIVAVNDEILKFDDIVLSIPALTPIAQ